MITRELLILAIGVFVGGNLGVLMMCLMAMAKQSEERVPTAELAWIRTEELAEL